MWLFTSWTIALVMDLMTGSLGVTLNVGILRSTYDSWMNSISRLVEIDGNITVQLKIMDNIEADDYDTLKQETSSTKRDGYVSIIGNYNPIVSTISEHSRIPYFVTSLVPYQETESPFIVRVFPDFNIFIQAIEDLIFFYNWKHVGLLYDFEEGSYLLAHLMGRDSVYVQGYNIAHSSSSDGVRSILKDMRDEFIEDFIVICTPNNTDTVLTQALFLSLLSRPNSWLVVNMGTDELVLDNYVDSRANLTRLQVLVDEHSPTCALNTSAVIIRKAIFYDAFRVFVGYLEQKKQDINPMRRILNEIKLDGCTGDVEFKRTGRRKDTFLQLLRLQNYINRTAGTWQSRGDTRSERIVPSQSYRTMIRARNDVFGEEPLRVTTLIEPPFIQWKNKTPDEVVEGERLEGFCIDILQEMSLLLKFKYNLSLVPDRKYGSLKPYGWTGMVNQLIKDRVDVALAPFSITPQRSEVVDFTKPYMTKGTTVVVRKPERSVWLFQFLSPLSKVVWIAIFIAFIVTGLVLFGVTRINSDNQPSWINNLRESYWYIWGTLLRGNLTGSPSATSGRVVSSVWWFFSLITLSIYTANLAAFLTIAYAHIAINSAADLANQDIFDYGTVDDSQIENFFKGTNISYYAKMYAYMTELSPESMVQRVEHGFARALSEKYAFLWDSPTVRHEIATKCDFMEIGTPFDLKGYGLGTQKNSRLTEKLSWAILKLNDEGILYTLEGKWWRRPQCPDPRQNAKSKAIEIQVASGMFIVLLGGIVLAAVVCLIEYIFFRRMHKTPPPEEIFDNDLQVTQNHIAPTTDELFDEPQNSTCRTLSIGENCVHSQWESEN